MTRGRAAATGLLAAGLVLAGCGVQPTGVLDAGESAAGLTKGLRLYYVSDTGRLEGVSRPDIQLTELGGVIKLLMDPPAPELRSGLNTLVRTGSYTVTGGKDRITVRIPDLSLSTSSVHDRNLTGQLVCSLARASAVLDNSGATRPDDVQVTLRPERGELGPYVCSDFLK
ncbi:hypothetical protein ABZW32_39820 [Streptomyces sp. NPDC004667]|uniref:hypothetical protein n=1 Tax=Streptomyces sp. NPDC004667 TaxID=3154285 RepID=UPI0033B7BD17